VKRSLALWLPPLAWTLVIHWLSSSAWGADETGSILTPLLTAALPRATPSEINMLHMLIRKGAHVGEFAVLAALWFRALVCGAGLRPVSAVRIAVGLTVGWAVVDEAYQATVDNRTGSLVDVGIDAIGAVVSLIIAQSAWGWIDRVTGVALWMGASGGAAAILVNLLADVDSGVLWIAVPAAAGVLVLRRIARRWSWPDS
jgi:VanZ family protein